MSCGTCVKLRPIKKGEAACKGSKPKIEDVRIVCCEQMTETISPSTLGDCTVGHISDVVSADPIGDPEPLVSIDVTNSTDLDELNEYSFDRAEDIGEDTFSIVLGVKGYDDDDDCTIQSLKGQDICVYYKISNRSGDWIWRRLKGKVTAVSGGLLAGYSITIDIVDPSDEERPLYVNFGTGTATTTALDLLTTFS